MVSNSRRGFSLLELVFVFVAVAVVGIVLALTTTDVLESNEPRRGLTPALSFDAPRVAATVQPMTTATAAGNPRQEGPK